MSFTVLTWRGCECQFLKTVGNITDAIANQICTGYRNWVACQSKCERGYTEEDKTNFRAKNTEVVNRCGELMAAPKLEKSKKPNKKKSESSAAAIDINFAFALSTAYLCFLV
uniref:Uncharacterized protein n=1 Tax=Ditylenchus dipsaci TaxID=166011 RepID=A0A915DPV7_9BILA